MVNIFVSDIDPKRSASAVDTKRLARMIQEGCELLIGALHRSSHEQHKRQRVNVSKAIVNHPTTKWVAADRLHFEWLLVHVAELHEMYMIHFKKDQPHASYSAKYNIAKRAASYFTSAYAKNEPIKFEGWFNYDVFRKLDASVIVRYRLSLLHKWLYDDERSTSWSGVPPVWVYNPRYRRWLRRRFGKPRNKVYPLNPSGSHYVRSISRQPSETFDLSRILARVSNRHRLHTSKTYREMYGDTEIIVQNGEYQYILARQWSNSAPLVAVSLNPLKGDDATETYTKLEGYARNNAYGGVVVLNLAAFKTSNIKKLAKQDDPYGEANESVVISVLRSITNHWCMKPTVMLCFGPQIRLLPDGNTVANSISRACAAYGNVVYLGTTKGYPRHPLTISEKLLPMRFYRW